MLTGRSCEFYYNPLASRAFTRVIGNGVQRSLNRGKTKLNANGTYKYF